MGAKSYQEQAEKYTREGELKKANSFSGRPKEDERERAGVLRQGDAKEVTDEARFAKEMIAADGKRKAESSEAVNYISSLIAETENKSMDKWVEISKEGINAASTTWEVNKILNSQIRTVRSLMAKQAKRFNNIEKQAKGYLETTVPYNDAEERLCQNMVGLIAERKEELQDMRCNVKKVLERVAAERRANLRMKIR